MWIAARRRTVPVLASVLLSLVAGMCRLGLACAHPPVIYSQPAYQSPVHGAPDHLLLLPGEGFGKSDTVVYARLPDTTRALPPPERIPEKNTAEQGVARIVSRENFPRALTVLLPPQLEADQSYVLWVRDAKGEWSNPVRINDARPLWLTPAYVYATSTTASLPRQIKIVGRNLQPAPGRATMARLTGPERVQLRAEPDADEPKILREYVAKLSLPPRLAPGEYRIELSRDGTSWVPLDRQTLTVRADPASPRVLAIDSDAFGGCHPDDGLDDTPCILRAIDAAARTGGVIEFGAGRWDLIHAAPGMESGNGIIVPHGVELRGAGNRVTRLVRHDTWVSGGSANTVFTLLGNNVVAGFTFSDGHVPREGEPARPILQLGRAWSRPDLNGFPGPVEDVVISANVFGPTHGPIVDGGLPLRRLFITHNIFGAFHEALLLGGNRFNVQYPFRIDDSVIAYNTFEPGSSLDVAAGQGVIASELGASRRLDFSHNTADGAATKYLRSPEDARGWRAAFFWHMNGSHEMTLVAENLATCTGDKAGDGEAFAYDNNGNTFALPDARTVLAAGASTLTVAGPLKTRQNDRDVPLATYYIGHWIQVVEGVGLGQVRRITDYRIDPRSGRVTFSVSPAWDVPPQAGVSRIGVGREFWQVYTLANGVDHREPLCRKSNRTRPKGGVIGLWAQTADSVVAGNRQYDTDGILMQNAYVAEDPACPECVASTTFQSFVEIRDNLIDGEYDWGSACSISGIMGSYAASPTPASPPPVLGFGVSIADNTIRHADGFKGGAIDFASTWYVGPPPHAWRLIENTLVQHNVIRDVAGAAPRPACQYRQLVRAGVRLDGPDALSRTVLYANSCANVAEGVVDYGTGTVRVCPSSVSAPCECRARR